MTSSRKRFRAEFRPMLRLALPLVAGEIGWMSMGVVDTMMVGRLPDAAAAMSSVALAQILFNTVAFGVGGVLLGLDTVVSQAHGGGRVGEANRWLVHGVYLALGLGAVLMGGFALATPLMRHASASPVIVDGAVRTLRMLNLGTLPLLLYFAQRRYLQAFNHARVIAAALITANLVNLLFNWLLIYAHAWRFAVAGARVRIGWAAGGVAGSGLSTTIARVYLAAFLATALLLVDRRHGYGLRRVSLRVDRRMVARLLRLGLPAGTTILVEVAIFAVVTFLISRFGAVALAGHEVALNCVSFTFMVPLGISAAASVRVGQAIGRRDAAGARTAGWSALVLSGGFMLCASAMYLAVPHALARVFTPDPAVIAATLPLFVVGALFQFCDGVQITAIGALRGAGDTHSGLLTHLGCYWLIGLPVGLYLGFSRHLGARGLWLGLSAALILAGGILLTRWRVVSRGL